MHLILKAAIAISIAALITTSAYSIIFIGEENNNNKTNANNNENTDFPEAINDNNDENNSTIDNESDIEKDFTHYVFVEAGTTVCCKACAQVHIDLDEYYESGKYPFYYVSIPVENEKAAEYLANYNILGYPTVYFDGGYEIIYGATDWKSTFETKISSAFNRKVPKVLVNVTAAWNENNDEIEINIILENYEETDYTGRLKVYLTEIVSTKWQGDQPYSYAFIEFAIDKNIEISSDENTTVSKTIDSSNLDPENLMIFAVVFNSEKHVGYSLPPDKNAFDAYYADVVDATEVIKGGNLPPRTGISSPTLGYIHRFGVAKRISNIGRTILLGRTKIVVDVSDDSSIEKVEFYINDKLMETITEEPYEWKWHKFTIGKRTITVKAYDNEGKTSTAKMDVLALIKWQNPIFKRI
ncbi:MAG: hypothetical protein JSW60_06085 [Thermoplasmatales archaeon]|nr:MAG: hypothetical protein JSW60_06085 [Thermoplasmatales archaeon]